MSDYQDKENELIMKSFFSKLKGRFVNWIYGVSKVPVKRNTNILMFLAPLVSVWIIEMLNKRSVVKGFLCIFTDPSVFFINYIIIFGTMSIVLLLKKRAAGIVAVSAVWVGLGIANYVMKGYRETPFSATDIKIAGSVTDIIEKYLSPVSFIVILMLLISVIMLVLFIWFKTPKYDKKINYLCNIAIMAVIIFVSVSTVKLGIKKDIVSEKFPNMSIAYQDYGFVYCFTCSVVNTGVERPKTYSTESIEDILDRLNNTTTVDKDNVQTPNIIFLQLESFFDVNKMKNLEVSEDPTPIFNKLKEEYPSGFLTVNNVGYGTANTEFEVMTGLNLDDFGPGEFPYKSILKTQTCESTAYILKDYGYSTHAMHNNNATFYSRNRVFKNLGYDTFTSVEFMNPEEYTILNWAKDAVLTEEIIDVLTYTDERDYLYCISVQGHGSYPKDAVLEETPITVGGLDDEEREYQFLYYVNQLKEMDDFIGELINELEKIDEDTVLVMYGDHLPSLGITEDEIENGNLYQTEYVMWNNFGLKLEDKDVETYQLASRLLQALNIDGGVINKYHQIYQNDENYLAQLKTLTYDMLYGDKYLFEGNSPYISTDMTLGTRPVTIKKIIKDMIVEGEGGEPETDTENPEDIEEPEKEYEEGYYYIIKGTEFTKYSYASVNDSQVDTEYIDEETLRIRIDEPLKSLDSIVVNQKWKASVVSRTSEYIYITAGDEIDENETTGDEGGVENEAPENFEE